MAKGVDYAFDLIALWVSMSVNNRWLLNYSIHLAGFIKQAPSSLKHGDLLGV